MFDLVEKWSVALIAGLVSFLAAWVLRGIDRNRYFKEQKVEHAKETITQLSFYIENWRRLMIISKLSLSRDLSEAEESRRDRYVENRDKARELLIANINMMPLFFEKKVFDQFHNFKRWDVEQSAKKIGDLPKIEDWEKWLLNLSDLLKRHIQS